MKKTESFTVSYTGAPPNITMPHTFPRDTYVNPWDRDECECDKRCPKCGKRKRNPWEIGPITCKH